MIINDVIEYSSGLSSLVSTIALIWTIYYYRKQTELLKTQIDEMRRQNTIQECLQLRDSTIRLHEVLTPLMIDEINEIDNFRDELNKNCQSPPACISYVHNLFSRQEGIQDIREKIARLVRDLKSLKAERFKNYDAFLNDIINSICSSPYSESSSECEVLDELDRMKEEYEEVIKVVDVLLDVKGEVMSEEVLIREVKRLGGEDLFDVMDKLSFLIDGECGGKLCKDVFPLNSLISGEINPLREMSESEGFCEKYNVKVVCGEYLELLERVKDIVFDVEKSKIFYALLYLNWMTSRFKGLINTLQLPSDVDLRIRLKAELERITCINE